MYYRADMWACVCVILSDEGDNWNLLEVIDKMAVHPAILTTAGAAIYILSWLFIFYEWFKIGSRSLDDTVEYV